MLIGRIRRLHDRRKSCITHWGLCARILRALAARLRALDDVAACRARGGGLAGERRRHIRERRVAPGARRRRGTLGGGERVRDTLDLASNTNRWGVPPSAVAAHTEAVARLWSYP